MSKKFEEWFGKFEIAGGTVPVDADTYKRFMHIAWMTCRQEIIKKLKENTYQPIDCGIEVIEPSIINEIEKEF